MYFLKIEKNTYAGWTYERKRLDIDVWLKPFYNTDMQVTDPDSLWDNDCEYTEGEVGLFVLYAW